MPWLPIKCLLEAGHLTLGPALAALAQCYFFKLSTVLLSPNGWPSSIVVAPNCLIGELPPQYLP